MPVFDDLKEPLTPHIRCDGLPPQGITIPTAETSTTAPWLNLIPGGSYSWNVKACYTLTCGDSSDWSAPFTFSYLYQPTATPPAPTATPTPGGGTIAPTPTPYECPTTLQEPPDGSTQNAPPTLLWTDPCAPGGGGNGPLSGGWYEVEITGQNQPPITLIVAAEHLDTGWLLLLPDTYTWRARSCADEDCIQASPWPDAWSFTYEDPVPTTPTPQSPQAPGGNGGGIQSGYTITRRSTYFLAGQAVAIRQVVEGGTNNLLHLHTDHLGSNSVMSYNNGGGMVGGSRTRYLPFVAYRTASTQTFTDCGFTGQKHNDDLGLIYYNARYYLPGIARFASADTLVPDPANPQQFNRYSYSLNNPIKYSDPSGHCAARDDACWILAEQLYEQYGWYIEGIWSASEIQIFLDAGQAIASWFIQNGGGDATGRVRGILGGTHFAHADFIGQLLNAHHVRGSTVFLLNGSFDIGTVVHELGHVLDNRLGFGSPIGSALFGNGVADEMSHFLGGDPGMCGLNRSVCSGYSTTAEKAFPSVYAGNGPSEDFAESFRRSVLDSDRFNSSHSVRSAFLTGLAESLTTTESEFILYPSIYLYRRIVPVPAPEPTNPLSSIGTPVP